MLCCLWRQGFAFATASHQPLLAMCMDLLGRFGAQKASKQFGVGVAERVHEVLELLVLGC